MTKNSDNTAKSTLGNTYAGLFRNSGLILLVFICLVVTLGCFNSALGQQPEKDNSAKTPIVTASVISDGVRISAPGTVVQLRLEVYDEVGQRLFDSEQQGGNVLDWHLQGGAGQRIADGTYLCVVTIKSPSGQLSQKLGLVTVAPQSTTLRPAGVADLNLQQAQLVGSIEGEDKALAVVPAENAPPVTVVTNTVDEAQLTRSRGALSFRFGDFFHANDKEQMRLTEEGNFGIGTAKPEAKLDVAGTIRARDGFLFSNGSALNVNEKGALTLTGSDGSVTPNVAGSGTQNRLTKWTDTAGTLGDSVVTELNGNIGIGTTNPASSLHVSGPGGASALTLDTPGSHKFRFQTVPNVPNWGALTLNASYNAGWRLDDPTTNGWFFKLDTRGGNAASDSNGLWLWRVPNGPNPHTDEYPVFGVTNGQAYFAGNVGIGTNTPVSKLDVNGNALVRGSGTVPTSLGANDLHIGYAIATPGTAGAVSRLAIQPYGHTGGPWRFVARDDSTKAYLDWIYGNNASGITQDSQGNVGIGTGTPAEKLTVAGIVQSTSGFKFPDGSVQTTAAGRAYTTLVSTELEVRPAGAVSTSIMDVNLYPGNYLLTATVQFENRANLFLQDNSRSMNCTFVPIDQNYPGGVLTQPIWNLRFAAAGTAGDKQPVTFTSVIVVKSVNPFTTVSLFCGVQDGNTDRSYVFAKTRRLTALRVGDFEPQPQP